MLDTVVQPVENNAQWEDNLVHLRVQFKLLFIVHEVQDCLLNSDGFLEDPNSFDLPSVGEFDSSVSSIAFTV